MEDIERVLHSSIPVVHHTKLIAASRSILSGNIWSTSASSKQTYRLYSNVWTACPSFGNVINRPQQSRGGLITSLADRCKTPTLTSHRSFGSRRKYVPEYAKPSDQEVTERFFRLQNGMWIRTRAGRRKKLWRKSPRHIHRLREHVFCKRAQCSLFDKMVDAEFKKPKYYINDPYTPYHKKSLLPYYRGPPKLFYP